MCVLGCCSVCLHWKWREKGRETSNKNREEEDKHVKKIIGDKEMMAISKAIERDRQKQKPVIKRERESLVR